VGPQSVTGLGFAYLVVIKNIPLSEIVNCISGNTGDSVKKPGIFSYYHNPLI
jgi:hypothetical protein